MSLRTISRVSGVLAAVAAVLGTALAVLAPGAAGLEQERVTLVPDGAQTVEYFPLIGNNLGTQVDTSTFIDSTICGVQTSCDVIPLTVPDPGHTDDFFVSIELKWDAAEIPNVPLLGDTATNDLDMYIQRDPREEGAGPDEDGFNYKSNGAALGEFIQMYRPVGNWNIFINNATGVNTGYTLTFTWRTDPVPNIFESLPPEFTGGPLRPAAPARPAAPLPVSPSVDLPEPEAVEALPSSVAPVAAAPDLRAGATLTPDSSFSSGFGDSASLDEELAGPPVQRFEPSAAVKAPPPSTASLLLWLLAVPLALLAIGAALLNRRRSALLQV